MKKPLKSPISVEVERSIERASEGKSLFIFLMDSATNGAM